MTRDVALIGPDLPDVRRACEALSARHIATPADASDAAWEAWRDGLSSAPRASAVVVMLLPEPAAPLDLAALATEDWEARGEAPLLAWMIALSAAATLCADGGAIVAVVDCPPPLDSAGLAPEAGVAEGVNALARSLALSEGKRGVRANSVVTPRRLVPGPPIAPDPPLAGFPGTLEDDVLGAVRMVLSQDAAYLSGHTLPADRGRSW